MQRIALNDLSRHSLAHREPLLRAINRVVDRGWFVHGPELEAFEQEFAQYCGAGHAVGVANGTDAIELAVRETIHGRAVKNADALASPQALEQFRGREELRK